MMCLVWVGNWVFLESLIIIVLGFGFIFVFFFVDVFDLWVFLCFVVGGVIGFILWDFVNEFILVSGVDEDCDDFIRV